MEDINPMVRIADALEGIAKMLERMANPPMLVRGHLLDKDITQVFPCEISYAEK